MEEVCKFCGSKNTRVNTKGIVNHQIYCRDCGKYSETPTAFQKIVSFSQSVGSIIFGVDNMKHSHNKNNKTM